MKYEDLIEQLEVIMQKELLNGKKKMVVIVEQE